MTTSNCCIRPDPWTAPAQDAAGPATQRIAGGLLTIGQESWLKARLDIGRALWRAGNPTSARAVLAGHGLDSARMATRPVAERSALLDAVCTVAATETERLAYYAAWHALLEIAPTAVIRDKLRDPRGGVRRAALLALLDRGNLDEPGVRSLVSDPDAATAGIAGLWLARLNGNPLIDISPPPGDFVDRVRVKIVPGLKPAVVRYTLDGTEPKFAKGSEGASLAFAATTTLKAVLFVDGQKVGATFTGIYRKIVPPPAPPAITLTPPSAPLTAAQVVAALTSADAARARAERASPWRCARGSRQALRSP